MSKDGGERELSDHRVPPRPKNDPDLGPKQTKKTRRAVIPKDFPGKERERERERLERDTGFRGGGGGEGEANHRV